MENTIVIATRNKSKTREIAAMAGEGVCVRTMDEFVPDLEIEEDGFTFAENARIKARAVWEALPEKCLVMADDSGLEIDFYDGRPGIFSARWLGEDTPYELKNGRILADMAEVQDFGRGAQFVCAMAAIDASGRLYESVGVMKGMIAHEARGENGFGYDPIFYIPEDGKTTAEMDSARKNEISHRGKALRALFEKLRAAGKIA